MDYKIVRSKRKSIAIQVKAHGVVLVRAPRFMRDEEIQKYVEEKEEWILKHQKEILEKEALLASEPKLTERELEALVKEARKVLSEKTAFYAEKMGVSYERISIRKQRTRWGSCSGKGNLNYNCLLMLAPDEVQDYVVVHELAHRKQMNHSKAFWSEVEAILPGYKEQKSWLSEHGDALMARIEEGPVQPGRFYAYILRCKDQSLYVGYTPNLEHRLAAHNAGTGAKYTRTRRPVELVYYEEFETKEEAFRREALLKQLTHREKEELIRNWREK